MKLDAHDILEALGFEVEEWDEEEHDYNCGYYLKRDGQVLMTENYMLKDNIAQLQQENEQLKQRLIEAERNALYWTVFDCPVNRDIAERILRKEN